MRKESIQNRALFIPYQEPGTLGIHTEDTVLSSTDTALSLNEAYTKVWSFHLQLSMCQVVIAAMEKKKAG